MIQSGMSILFDIFTCSSVTGQFERILEILKNLINCLDWFDPDLVCRQVRNGKKQPSASLQTLNKLVNCYDHKLSSCSVKYVVIYMMTVSTVGCWPVDTPSVVRGAVFTARVPMHWQFTAGTVRLHNLPRLSGHSPWHNISNTLTWNKRSADWQALAHSGHSLRLTGPGPFLPQPLADSLGPFWPQPSADRLWPVLATGFGWQPSARSGHSFRLTGYDPFWPQP